MEFREIWNILIRRKWILIQSFILILFTTIVITNLLPPVYEATTKVLVESPGATASMLSGIGLDDLSSLIGGKGVADLGTKVTLAKVDPILEKVANLLQIRNENGDIYPASKMKESGLLYKIFPHPFVDITEDISSNSLTILSSSRSLDEVVYLANTLANVYVEETRKQRLMDVMEAGKFIDQQIIEVKNEYFDAIKKVNEFQQKNGSLDIELETRIALEKLAELMKQKEDNLIDISEVESRLRVLKGKLGAQDSSRILSKTVSDNANISGLLKNLYDLQIKMSGLMIEKTAEHPEIVATRKQIEEINNLIKNELSVYKDYSPELVSLELDLEALKAHLIGVNRNIEKYTKLAQTIPVKSSEMSKLMLSLTASQNMYSSLLDSRFKIGVAKAMTLSDVRVIEYANRMYSLIPVSPKKLFNYIIGAFLGLLFGMGLALFVDYLDTTVKTSDDLKPFDKLYSLGSIPYMKKDRLIFKLESKHPAVETFRTIRNALQFATLEPEVGPILITSCEPSVGKSTIVTDLSISFAQAGNKVLVVDTDMRNPSLHTFFNISNEKGLTSLLSNKATPDEVIIDTGIEGVKLLPCGPIPPDPGLFIESDILKKYIEQFRGSFDIIVFDSPPMFIVSDAVILSKLMGNTVLIIESGRTNKEAVSDAEALFVKAGVRRAGAIINKIRRTYSKYTYPAYYKSYYYHKKKK